jgi:hypothetical protein
MIYQPRQRYPLHPGADKGDALSAEKEPVVPVFQRSEYGLYPDAGIKIQVQNSVVAIKF